MDITITSFRCTEQGLEAIFDEELELSQNERRMLDVVVSAAYANNDEKDEIKAEFNDLVNKVDLTRLVALKLLTFNDGKRAQFSVENAPLIQKLLERQAGPYVRPNTQQPSIKQTQLLRSKGSNSTTVSKEHKTINSAQKDDDDSSVPKLQVAMGMFL